MGLPDPGKEMDKLLGLFHVRDEPANKPDMTSNRVNRQP
jgi:hypothetical protein